MESQDILEDLSPDSMPKREVAERLLSEARERLRSALTEVSKLAGVLLSVCVLVSAADSLDLSGKAPLYIRLSGVAAIGGCALSDFDSYLNLGLSSLQSLSDYSRVLLPCISSAAAASGALTSAAAKYAATALFMDILLSLAKWLIVPSICAYAALSLSEAALGGESLKSARKVLKAVCTLLLTGLSLTFTAWLGLTGILSGSADSLTARMTKTAVSAALPVVGGILADAAGSLTVAAAGVRNSVGIFGMIAVLTVCLGPFIRLGLRYILFKLAGALSECVTDKKLSELIENVGSCFGLILAINGTGALFMFISLFSFLRTAV